MRRTKRTKRTGRRRFGQEPAPRRDASNIFGTALLVAGLGVAGYGIYKATAKKRMPSQLEVTTVDPAARIKQIEAATPYTGEQQFIKGAADVLDTATTVATVGAVGAGALGAALPILALVC